MSMHKITPTYLDQYVNFFYEDEQWQYAPNLEISMPKLQAEGAAKAWNLLADHHIALLADEVGTGKTIQALAVMVSLWRQKPDAKILLYAPNENVAKKWVNEYHNFIRYHYRFNDDIVKSSINSEPLRKAFYCENHSDLLRNSLSPWASFFVCKTSSLSGFLSPKITQEFIDEIGIKLSRDIESENNNKDNQIDWLIKLSKESNSHFYKRYSVDGLAPFDLLIFDEAHYLRRSEGESIRSIVSHSFFAGRDIRKEHPWGEYRPLAKNVLLMTATPNHSSSADIQNIVSLFNPQYYRMSPEDILKNICIRRFRRLSGKTKYEYRQEIPGPVKLGTLAEKLFFAAYQKSLVQYRSTLVEDSTHNNPYRILFGYLEGFEFLPSKRTESLARKMNEARESGGDFLENDDASVIIELSKKYHQAYKTRPKHPKYDKIIAELTPSINPNGMSLQKKLVFVRRIPSVYEISTRLIENYDEWFIDVMSNCFSKKQRKAVRKINLRSLFWQLAQKDPEEMPRLEQEYEPSEKKVERINDEIPSSRILDLFTIKKEGKFKTTDCSNFRTRFTRNEQIFSIFFEPASDYRSGVYTLKMLYEKERKRLYKNSAQYERISNLSAQALPIDLEIEYDIKYPPQLPSKTGDNHFTTLLSIWYGQNIRAEEPQNDEMSRAKVEYDSWTILEKEGFSTYLEKGILFSSPYIVYFYSYFKNIQKTSPLKRGEELYNAFCDQVSLGLVETGLAKTITSAILTFRIFYKKELGLTHDKLINEKWAFLNHTIPVYPYCGDTQRQTIVRAFNTPFFPNALIATSVLQEGVDLHYHCSEVIHYGIAWTQGDNEQRVGRVDRMFGKLENELKINAQATLPIHYPYLAKTIDEEQMARFILRKSESEKLIDQFKNINKSSEVNLLEKIDSNWHANFRTPIQNPSIEEPYGIHIATDFDPIPTPPFTLNPSNSIRYLIHPIVNTLKNRFKREFVNYLDGPRYDPGTSLFGIKHVIVRSGRHQPIIGEVEYIEQGMTIIKQPSYCLRLKTPIARRGIYYNDLRRFGIVLKKIYQSNPLLKICCDKRAKGSFKYYVCVEMPLFLVGPNGNNISDQELLKNIDALIWFSDELEKKYHDGDIQNDEIITDAGIRWSRNHHALSTDRPQLPIPRGWKRRMKMYIAKSKEIHDESIKSIDDTYTFNHHNRFVRTLPLEKSFVLEVGIYRNDILLDEINILENIYGNY